MHAPRAAALLVALCTALLLAGCGFHPRRAAVLPPDMGRVHLSVSGSNELADELRRQLRVAGAEVVPASGPDAAELTVRAGFESRALTVSGFAKVQEFTVIMRAEAGATTVGGAVLLAPAVVEMQREFTYDRTQALGTATREEQVRASLVTDMAAAILRRLQTVGPAADATSPDHG